MLILLGYRDSFLIRTKTAVRYSQDIQQGFLKACTSPLALFIPLRFGLTFCFATHVIIISKRLVLYAFGLSLVSLCYEVDLLEVAKLLMCVFHKTKTKLFEISSDAVLGKRK